MFHFEVLAYEFAYSWCDSSFLEICAALGTNDELEPDWSMLRKRSMSAFPQMLKSDPETLGGVRSDYISRSLHSLAVRSIVAGVHTITSDIRSLNTPLEYQPICC